MGAPRHSQETRDAVVAAYAEGKTLGEAAALGGVHASAAQRWVTAAGAMRSRPDAAPNRTDRDTEVAIAAAYGAGESAEAIADRMSINRHSVTRIIHRLGRPVRSAGARPGALDEHFFDEIDTEEKAYWLGFIAADGCVTDDGVLSVALSAVDAGHLEKLRSALGADAPVRHSAAPLGSKFICGRPVVSGPSARLATRRPRLVAGLARHGVTPRKSLTAVAPDLRPDLMRHYWRGAFDGDGGIWKATRRDAREAGASFIGSDAMVLQFRDFARAHCGAVGTMAPYPRTAGMSTFGVGGAFVTFRLLDLLYRDATVSLDRKRVLYEEIAASARDPRKLITANGLTLRVTEWARRTGIARETITRRIERSGWSPEDAVNTPVRRPASVL